MGSVLVPLDAWLSPMCDRCGWSQLNSSEFAPEF